MSAQGGRTWTIRRGEPGYPAPLLDLGPDAPARLYGCGNRSLIGGLELHQTVTIVGSRRPSSYGLRVAEDLGQLLAAAGLVVVSGMARGIDAAVHRGALAAGGLTLAVLGGGADVVYPASERQLYRDLLSRGAVISEAPPGQRPQAGAFPKRNRIMAALGAITVVVGAAEPSGSLITANRALELNRQVGAVPGPVTSSVSKGTNALLVDGGAPIRGAQDVLDRLLGVGVETATRSGPRLDEELARIADAVSLGSSTCDAVALEAGIAAGDAAVALARLELLGYVETDAAGRHVRTTLLPPDAST